MAQSFTKSKASAHNLGGGTSSTLPPPLAQAPEMDAVGAVVFNQIRKGSIRRLRRSFELEPPGSFRRSSSSASPREEKAPDFGRGDEGEAEGDAPAEEAAMELRQYDGFDGRRQEEEDERERRASNASNASAGLSGDLEEVSQSDPVPVAAATRREAAPAPAPSLAAPAAAPSAAAGSGLRPLAGLFSRGHSSEGGARRSSLRGGLFGSGFVAQRRSPHRMRRPHARKKGTAKKLRACDNTACRQYRKAGLQARFVGATSVSRPRWSGAAPRRSASHWE